MASLGGSLRQAGVSSSRGLRPNLSRRPPSSSSEASYASDGSASDDQFVFSAGNTPTHEYPRSATLAAREDLLFGKQAPAATSDSSDAAGLARSKPIAIELPPVRKTNLDPGSAPATTPPAPLSGRGDIPGGYFPLHEDPKSRVHRPHPFHLDATKARRRSLQRAAEAIKAPSPVVTMLEPSPPTVSGFSSAVSSSIQTPVSSYIPTGVHEQAALPLGKYYPSNYEKRPANNQRQHLNVPGRTGISMAAKSESQVPKYHQAAHKPSHNRTNSEVKRRLQQYQRDMVAQATVAASALLANRSGGLGGQSDLTTIQGVPLPGNMSLGVALVKTHKPISPRLAPLGSPGPVTPMSLEGEADGYLTLDRVRTDKFRVEHERLEEGGSGAPISV